MGPASNAGITSSTGLASKIDLALRDQILIVSVENVSTWHLLGLAYFLTGLVSAGLGSNWNNCYSQANLNHNLIGLALSVSLICQ